MDGPESGTPIVLAHGAGAPMDSPFMNEFCRVLAREGLRVIRFEFPYMCERRRLGGRRPPNRMPVLLETWREVVAGLGDPARLWIGGKSMGGRIASMLADELGVAGLVVMGYPFHPAGKPEKLRTAHLHALRTQALFLQGTRDRLGSREESRAWPLSPSIRLCWLEDGDHSWKPRKRSGFTWSGHIQEAGSEVVRFISESSGRLR